MIHLNLHIKSLQLSLIILTLAKENLKMTYDDVIKHFGGGAEHAAVALGVSVSTVQKWRKKGISGWSQWAIQGKTNGKLKADK